MGGRASADGELGAAVSEPLRPHPAADLFPMLSDEDLAPMVEDMRANGYDHNKPILRYRSQVLDGRNRLRAAALAGVDRGRQLGFDRVRRGRRSTASGAHDGTVTWNPLPRG